MHDTKIEVVQNDGISVKERIITFFTKGIDRKNAEALYQAAEFNGFQDGNDAFDKSIEIICKGLGLDADELALEITKHQSSNS